MSNKNNLVFNLIAAGVLGYGAYMLFGMKPDTSWMDTAKFALASVGGTGYLLYNNLSSLKGLFSQQKRSHRVFIPADFEEQDFKCLIHLRNRVTEAGSTEGVEVCAKLNEIIFSLHAKENMKVATNAKIN